MNTSTSLRLITAQLFLQLTVFAEGPASVGVHQGICDASGIVTIDDNKFAVADDEKNLLKIYQVGQSGPALYEVEISEFIGNQKQPKDKKKTPKKNNKKTSKKPVGKAKLPKSLEADLEGATRVGNIIYWISSHGRKSNGELAEERMRFFATEISGAGSDLKLTTIGQTYSSLLQDLIADPRYARLGLATASTITPKSPGGLNIEALTDKPDGTILIGFQSPQIKGSALIVPLLNPQEVIQNNPAKFGDPILLNLQGAGIRGMASNQNLYLLVTNAVEKLGVRPAIYQWDGQSNSAKFIQEVPLQDFKSESIAIYPTSGKIHALLISDDGTRIVKNQECKKLKDDSLKSFRSIYYEPQLIKE